MYFLRWLTGHPAVLIALITGVYALINWSNLYHWFGDEKVGAEHALEVTHEAPAGGSMSGMKGMDGMSGMSGMQGMEGQSDKVGSAVTAAGVTAAAVGAAATAASSTEKIAPSEERKSLFNFFGRNDGAPAGMDGMSGMQGMDGMSGMSGMQGMDGMSGMSGMQGMDGMSGMSGMQGMDGMSGMSGMQGMDGMSGMSGMQGMEGQSGKVDSAVAAGATAAAVGAAATATDSAETAAPAEEKKSLFEFFRRKEAPTGMSGMSGMEGMSGMSGMNGMSGMSGMAGMSGMQDMSDELLQKLADARKAFWDKDADGAKKIYKELIEAKPENPNLLGEYGNLMVQSQQFEEAVDTYERAANLLIDQKRYREVQPLVRFIGNFDRPRAEKIVQRLRDQQ